MTQQEQFNLLPCPFCGGNDIRFTEHKRAGNGDHAGENIWSMCCYNCGAKVPNQYEEHGRDMMIKKWNTRVPAKNQKGK